ncbi:MAG TPA: signal peptidase I [Brevefilum fermentans]|uniref:signal peptidase I n=1 Tax=Candidatus Brevifilum fermentans TaxID=1986204 RepID=UPI001E5482B5|nr:signal peptidase I [Brevefilum fermentans]MDI9566740.1 signal peptidase I [Chloroflexota bacterium]HOM67878.1 signal peptidase I [Brevefilum fermentans]HPX95969.1 signal peptidase I [Brevefilum fermentans]HQA28908.1 signal peptidase I [Brevefilum fermentans]
MITEKNLSCDTQAFSAIAIDLLDAGRTLRFTAKGGSMDPLIRDGDTLFLAPADPSRIKFGDVVFFVNGGGKPLIHRVIKTQKRGKDRWLLIRGDRANNVDGYFPPSEIFGRVIAVERVGQQIRADQPVYKFLGRLAAWRSRVFSASPRLFSLIYQLIKRIPSFKHYLS